MGKMIEVWCKIVKWQKQHKEELFAVLSIIFAITAFVCMYINWKMSLLSCVISLVLPHRLKDGILYRIQKFGRILSRIVLLLIILWVCGDFIGWCRKIYRDERMKFSEARWFYIPPTERTLIDYWYVLPQAFGELIEDIW